MNRLSVILMLFVFACLGNEVYDYFESSSQAFVAYQTQAAELARDNRHSPPFESIEGYIIDVRYILVSMKHEGRNQIRLKAIQSVHFQKGLPTLNWGGRKVARTEHRVLMTRCSGTWCISELEENVTEVTGLDELFDIE